MPNKTDPPGYCWGEQAYEASCGNTDSQASSPDISEAPQQDAPSSFHFFETLLDASEDAHPGSKAFYNELIQAGLLHAQKQKDYGKPEDPFANVRSSEEWGIPPWVGAMVRLNDKVKRLQSFARTGVLENESAIDSFRDIAVYALIALVLYGEEGKENSA